MIRLSEETAVSYLIECGLLSPHSAVHGSLIVSDLTRRNRNLGVVSDQGGSYLLKQGNAAGSELSLAHEAAVHERLTAYGTSGPARFLPHCYGYDAATGILVSELVPDAQNLREYVLRHGRFPARLGSATGTVLGTLHREVRLTASEIGGRNRPAWALHLHRPDRALLRMASLGNLQLVKAVQRFPAFVALLECVRVDWRPVAFIHGDIKWDHFLMTGKPTAAGEPVLKLVDWEGAGPGDPGWDVGSIFAEYLQTWLGGIPVAGEEAPTLAGAQSRYPLERMHPALCAFWRAYVAAAKIEATDAEGLLLRAVRFGAVRLLQSAYEGMQMEAQLTSSAVGLLQLSWNILQRPPVAAATLLGLPVAKGGEG